MKIMKIMKMYLILIMPKYSKLETRTRMRNKFQIQMIKIMIWKMVKEAARMLKLPSRLITVMKEEGKEVRLVSWGRTRR